MDHTQKREFGPLVSECKKRGIGETRAYQYAAAGLIETFTIGRKRFVYLDSILALPSKIANERKADA